MADLVEYSFKGGVQATSETKGHGNVKLLVKIVRSPVFVIFQKLRSATQINIG